MREPARAKGGREPPDGPVPRSPPVIAWSGRLFSTPGSSTTLEVEGIGSHEGKSTKPRQQPVSKNCRGARLSKPESSQVSGKLPGLVDPVRRGLCIPGVCWVIAVARREGVGLVEKAVRGARISARRELSEPDPGERVAGAGRLLKPPNGFRGRLGVATV